MANYGYAKLKPSNSYDRGMENKIAANSLVVATGDFVALSGGFVILATSTTRIEGVSVSNKTYASDNQTVAQRRVEYKPASPDSQWQLPIVGGSITQADVGKYFNIVDATQAVDGTTASTSTGQLRLEAFIATGVGIFSIVNK